MSAPSRVLLDTHILLYWLGRDPRLSPEQAGLIAEATAEEPLWVADISLWEIATLLSLGRLGLQTPLRDWLEAAVAPPLVRRIGVSPTVAAEVAQLPDSFTRDPADRIIVAATRALGARQVEAALRDVEIPSQPLHPNSLDALGLEGIERVYDELLDLWEKESTKVVTASVELAALDPADRLLRAAHLILEHELGRMDLYFRAWAQHCPEVYARVNEVYDMRLSWVRQIFRELGFKGDDVEMRARLFVAYHAWEQIAFADQSKAQAKRLIKRRIEFFIRP